MQTRTKIKVAILAWLVAEVAALAIAVQFLGWLPTLALGFATSTLGLMILRKAGRDSLATLKRAMDGRTAGAQTAPAGGLVHIVSGIFLLLPGLVSDVVGLLLLTPFVSRRLTGVFGVAGRPAQRDGVLDLDPDEWRSAQDRDGRPPCEPHAGMLPGDPKAAQRRSLDDE
ncbi:MAG: hypothetical protein JWN07_1124 [Hyphomicrobiales bacterium]|nr:hypothetical protein [Hyphomicrobiales bacterium]